MYQDSGVQIYRGLLLYKYKYLCRSGCRSRVSDILGTTCMYIVRSSLNTHYQDLGPSLCRTFLYILRSSTSTMLCSHTAYDCRRVELDFLFLGVSRGLLCLYCTVDVTTAHYYSRRCLAMRPSLRLLRTCSNFCSRYPLDSSPILPATSHSPPETC